MAGVKWETTSQGASTEPETLRDALARLRVVRLREKGLVNEINSLKNAFERERAYAVFLELERDKLRSFVRKAGHLSNCASRVALPEEAEASCDCGYDQMLETAK